MNGGGKQLRSLIYEIFSSKGLEVKGNLRVLKRFPGEGHGNVQLDSLDKLVRFFGEGTYYFECENVIVKVIDEEHSFSINYILIDSEYKDGKWHVRISTDEEETYNPDINYLEQRRKKIIAAIQSSLEILAFSIKLYSDRYMDPPEKKR